MENYELARIPKKKEDESKLSEETKKRIKENETYWNRVAVEKISDQGKFFSDILEKQSSYIERYPLREDGEIDGSRMNLINGGRTLLERVKHVDVSREGLNKYINKVREQYPTLYFQFSEQDNELILKVELEKR